MIHPLRYDTPKYAKDLLDNPEVAYLHSPRRDPSTPELWWRVLPNTKSDIHALPLGALDRNGPFLDPQQAVNIALWHFSKLEAFGLHQPTIYNYMENRQDPDQTRLYSVAHHVEGIGGEELCDYPQYSHILQSIGWGVKQYVDWIESSSQKYMFWDINDPPQYVYGTAPNETVPRTYLVDIDPLLQLALPEHLETFREHIFQQFPY